VYLPDLFSLAYFFSRTRTRTWHKEKKRRIRKIVDIISISSHSLLWSAFFLDAMTRLFSRYLYDYTHFSSFLLLLVMPHEFFSFVMCCNEFFLPIIYVSWRIFPLLLLSLLSTCFMDFSFSIINVSWWIFLPIIIVYIVLFEVLILSLW